MGHMPVRGEPIPVKFLTAEWRSLALLNYAADPSLLRARVPRGTELDDWNGITYLSLVGFLFLRTRIFGVTAPFHQRFLEVNLRFYVRRKTAEGWCRGVVFIKEIVPQWTTAVLARMLYHENYVCLPMRHTVTGHSTEYCWKLKDEWNTLSVCDGDTAALPAAGSREEFITEHYWGYTVQPDSGTLEYRVEHPRWLVRRAAGASFNGNARDLYGADLARVLANPVDSALLADGSAVTVFRGQRLVLPDH